jgi:hypothetical protein
MLGILAGLKAGRAWLAALPQILLVLVVTLPLTFLLGQCDGRRSEAARQDAAERPQMSPRSKRTATRRKSPPTSG